MRESKSSPTGWWIVKELLYWMPVSASEPKSSTRVLVWENTGILKSRTFAAAFKKALKMNANAAENYARNRGGVMS